MRIDRTTLLAELESVRAGLSKKEVIEQSGCFVFLDNRVYTYNDEVACSRTLSADMEGFSGAVQAAPLLALLDKLPEDDIQIKIEDGEIQLSGKRRKAGIRMESEIVLPVDDVQVPDDESGEWFELDKDFCEGLNVARECVSSDESYFSLTCIHISPTFIEACDNIQASRYLVDTGFPDDTLIRQEAAQHIGAEAVIYFALGDDWVHFANDDGLVVSCRRYKEDYPDLQEIVEFSGHEISLPPGLADAADKANIFAAENDDTERQINVALSRGRIQVRGQGPNGWYTETKKLTSYDGPNLRFLISPRLLGRLATGKQSDGGISKCEILPSDANDGGKLKADSHKWTYVTCLERTEDA